MFMGMETLFQEMRMKDLGLRRGVVVALYKYVR